MEDGFIILVFIAIAVIQGIGQKRRQDAKKRQKPMGVPPRPPQRASTRPSQGASTPPGPETQARPTPSGTAKPGGSEGLIPSDVWQEILGLARGTAQVPGTRTAPPESVEGPEERPRSLEASHGAGEPTPESTSPEPPIRDRQIRPRTPEEIRRPSETAPKEKEVVPVSPPLPAAASAVPAVKPPDPAASGSGEGGREARAQLFGEGSVEELRKAIILKEVLGPPLALRDEAS